MASSPSNELCYGPLCDSICMHGNFLCSNKYICRLLVSYIIYDLCSIIPVVGDLPVLKIRMNLGGHHRPYRYIQYIEVHLILVWEREREICCTGALNYFPLNFCIFSLIIHKWNKCKIMECINAKLKLEVVNNQQRERDIHQLLWYEGNICNFTQHSIQCQIKTCKSFSLIYV